MAKKQNNVMKWINFIAFGLLLLGGLSWFFIGVFQWNIFGMFGGYDGFLSRIFYTLFGIGALWLIGIIIHRVFMSKPKKEETRASAA